MEGIIVLFEVTLKKDKLKDYLAQAAMLKEDLVKAEGFICAERFSSLAAPNKLLSMPIWETEEHVARWRNFMAHRICQKHSREEDFADYKITVVSPIRTYSMNDRKEAPAASINF